MLLPLKDNHDFGDQLGRVALDLADFRPDRFQVGVKAGVDVDGYGDRLLQLSGVSLHAISYRS